MLRRFALALLLAVAPLATATCGPDGPVSPDAGPDAGPDAPHGCTLGFVGDKAKDPELTVTVLGAAAPAVPIADGDMVPLIFPPQGGRVIFAGVRVRNVDPCGAVLTGALRDVQTQQVRLDARTINLLPASDGWGESDATDSSSFSNIPVCPNQWSMTNVYGTAYQLEISLTDCAGRTVSRKLKVTPRCAEPDGLAECLCTCQGGYKLGMTCNSADAGADGGDAGDTGDSQ